MKKYKVQVVECDAVEGQEPISFEFETHDDLRMILARQREKGLMEEEEAKAFVVGLKLFSTVLLAHRTEELFVEISAHFGSFMKKLKGR